MKIVKQVGERLLPSWLRTEIRPVLVFTGAGTALLTGSIVLAARGWVWHTERLTLGERVAALLAGGYLAMYSCAHAPDVARFAAPSMVVVWCAAAWCVAPPAIRDEPAATSVEAAPAPPPDDVYTATLAWIRQQIGDRQGVHLRDLLDHAQQHGMFETLDVTELRTHLERWGIPVRKRVRVRGLGITVGIYRDDLPPLPEPLPDPDGQDPPDSELHAV
jgi:hypothetical protein